MDDNIIRSNRKLEHMQLALKNGENSRKTGLDDIVLIHKALPKFDFRNININTFFLNKELEAPLYINAITGGHKKLKEINELLGNVARETGIAVAVGSQKSGIIDSEVLDTYSIVRKANPKGIVIGNLSANASLDEAKKALEMIEADALQLHLNVAQEIMMTEGDRNFKQIKENICNIKNNISVPVIVKEVGCGMSMETIRELMEMQVEYIDISGVGGTNFIAIEFSRQNGLQDQSLLNWGIPTAYSMMEAKLLGFKHLMISGGITNALDCTKCLAMGATMVGFSGEILKQYNKDVDLIKWIEELKNNIRRIMLLTNSLNLDALKSSDRVIKGDLLEWVNIREKNIEMWRNSNVKL